jgi:Ca2+-binding EF-hand superfamily protein
MLSKGQGSDSFGSSNSWSRPSSRATSGTLTANDATEPAQADADQLAVIKRCSRLLKVFAAVDINDEGRVSQSNLCDLLQTALAIDIPARDYSKIMQYVATHMHAANRSTTVSRVDFVRAFCNYDPTKPFHEKSVASRHVHERGYVTSASVDHLAKTILDDFILVDMSQKLEYDDTKPLLVPAADLMEILRGVLDWPDEEIVNVLVGRNERLGDPVEFDRVLENFSIQKVDMRLLIPFSNLLQANRMTIFEAFRHMDSDNDGSISIEEFKAFMEESDLADAGESIHRLFGEDHSMDYTSFRSKLDTRNARSHPFSEDWEEATLKKMREWAHFNRMTITDAFKNFCSGAIMNRAQFHKALRSVDEDLTEWQMDHLARFFNRTSKVAITLKDWLVRLEPESRPSGWSEAAFQRLANTIYGKKQTLEQWLISIDSNRDGNVSVAELQRALMQLTADQPMDHRLSLADANELAILTDVGRTGFVQVEGDKGLRARLNKGYAKIDTDSHMLELLRRELLSGTTRGV